MAKRGRTPIQLSIALNTEALTRGVKSAQSQLNKLSGVGDIASKGMKGLGTGLKVASQGALVLTAGAAAAGVKLLELGSDAEESANAFQVTFKEAEKSLGSFVDDFANKAGFTTSELQQLLSFTGGVTNAMGATAEESAELSKTVAQLAGDIGSLKNIPAEQAVRAMTSALTGERESLKSLGLVIKQSDVDQKALTMTNKSSVKELTNLEKAHATVALITEASSDAIGDLDATQDSFANTTRRLKAELRQTGLEMGQELLPAVSGVLPILSKLAQDILPILVDAFSKGVVAVQEFLDKFGDDILKGLKKSFQLFQDLGTIFFHMVGKFIDFIKSSDILMAIFEKLGGETEGLMDKIHNYAESIREANDEEKRLNKRREESQQKYKSTGEAVDETADSINNLTNTTEDSTDAIEDNTDAVGEQAETYEMSALEFNKYTDAMGSALSAIKTLSGLQEKGKREEERLEEATGELEEANIQVAHSQAKLAAAQEKATSLQKDGTEVTAEEELAIINLRESIDELTDAQDGSRKMELELALAKQELNELIDESTKQSDTYFDAVKSVQDAEEDLKDAIEEQKKARDEQIQAKKDLAEASKISAENILQEASAIQKLEQAFGEFSGGTFQETLEKLSEITGRKIAEIQNAFANAGLTSSSFTPPNTNTGSSSPVVEPPPTLVDVAGSDSNGGSSSSGSGNVQPVKIFTTLNISGERFETVTQDAIINLQKQGKRILI
jgi:methyl-accepting chemotaxis protein